MPRMLIHRIFLSCIASCALSAMALAGPLVYVSNTLQFGTVDLSSGAFQQIGPDLPDPSQGLAYASNGSLFTLGFSGILNSIDPGSGVMTAIGATGLSDCSTPSSPCGPNSVNVVASLGGQLYATDLQNRLYSVDPSTGAASSIGLTGMPAIPFIPLSQNPDGTVNIYDEAFFEAGGELYATLDAGNVDFATGTLTPVIAGKLYRIDPATAIATPIGPTVFGLGAAVEVNGTVYAFLNVTHELASLDLATGQTAVIGSFDQNAGIASAAVVTPEPATNTVALGLAVLFAAVWTRRRTPRVPRVGNQQHDRS